MTSNCLLVLAVQSVPNVARLLRKLIMACIGRCLKYASSRRRNARNPISA